MAQAWALRVYEMRDDQNGNLLIQYDGFLQKDNGTVHSVAPLMAAPAGMTPQQFRAALTAALLAEIALYHPDVTITAQDCMVDVVQRGV